MKVRGVVTACRDHGFFLQDPTPDDDPATSEGIFVFTGAAPTIATGDAVEVHGVVAEYRPGCGTGCAEGTQAYANLTTTQIAHVTTVRLIAREQPLADPVAIGFGAGTRTPPTDIIDASSLGDVEAGPTRFDPRTEGIDFYESLEGMRVAIPDAVVVGPTRRFGNEYGSARSEVVVIPEGPGAGPRTRNGGIRIAPGDFNPERIHVANGRLAQLPGMDVGDRFIGPIIGVVDYSFGNFKLLLTEPLPAVRAPVTQVRAPLLEPARLDELTLATLNVENLHPAVEHGKLAHLAHTIVHDLRAPDLIALQEVQDNSGPDDDGVIDASASYTALISAIRNGGGPPYHFADIPPQDGADGGQPGGNIRVGFLYRLDSDLQMVTKAGARFDTPNEVLDVEGRPTLRYSPGRIDPSNDAFSHSRKPLAMEMVFRGHSVFVIGTHLNAKLGDQPLFGRFQPPARPSEIQRLNQARATGDFVASLLAIDPHAFVVVMGDLNDFEFSAPVSALERSGLINLVETLPPDERYTSLYQGNAQVLDHMMVSPSLRARLVRFHVAHVHVDFHDGASDHDPCVARVALGMANQVPHE